MRMLSKTAILCKVAILLLWLPGTAQAALNVFACEPEWAALAKGLGGERLEIYSATTARQDPHHIQARPSLIAKARKADLLICTGAELEVGWLPLLLRKAGNARTQPGKPGHFFAAEYVEMLEVPVKLDRRLGDIHASGNPHIHTDPRNMLRVAEVLHQRLMEIDPDGIEIYSQRFEVFGRDWQLAIDRWAKLSAPVHGVDVVVHHDYWLYLIYWLGLNKIAALEPVPGVSPSTSHLAEIKQLLKAQPAEMIIDTSYMNDRPAQWLSEHTAIPVVTLPATVDFYNDETLHDWFSGLVDLIKGAVK